MSLSKLKASSGQVAAGLATLVILSNGAWSADASVSASGAITRATLAANSSVVVAAGDATSAGDVTTIEAAAGPAPAVINMAISPNTIATGGTAKVTWTATNAAKCTKYGAWEGEAGTRGEESTGTLKSSATYLLKCKGNGPEVMQSVRVTVADAPPTISLTANPNSISKGQRSELTWTTTNIDYCEKSGSWSGGGSAQGSQTTGLLNTSANYVLTCHGPGGTVVQSAAVSVSGSPPTLNLTISPNIVARGGNATLHWSTANVTSCEKSGAWSGESSPQGSQSAGFRVTDTTFVLTCKGPDGIVEQSAVLSVGETPPTITLAASPTTVKTGGSSTLTWSATNVTSCDKSGSWTGAAAAQGAQSTGALATTATYQLTCRGPGGSVVRSVQVGVNASAPTLSLAASPTTVKSGAGSVLSWSSANATSCTASGGWAGTLATTGSSSTGALTQSTRYTLTCTGSGGTASQTLQVNVTATQPTNGNAILSWVAPTVNVDGTPVTALSGYHVFYGNSTSNMTHSIAVSGATNTSAEISGLTSGTWYFAVAADAVDGTESPESQIGSKSI